MKVAHATVQEFVAEARREAEHLWRKQIRFVIDKMPEQKEEVSFKIWLVLTALVQAAEGEYIIECVLDCGSDDPYDHNRTEGTDKANAELKEVWSLCERHGLEALPGKLEAF